MAVQYLPTGYPGGQKITIATWFRLTDGSSANDNGNNVGAAYDTNSHAIPTGGFNSIPNREPTLMDLAGSLVPLCEWGYRADTATGPATGDEFSGPQQALCGLYLDPPRVGKHDPTKGSVVFAAKGPIFPNISFATDTFPDAAGPSLLTEGGITGASYATISTYALGFKSVTGIDRSTWLSSTWNFLLTSADLSPLDTISSAHYVVKKKIWFNCNSVFDTPGGGDASGFEQGYPIPGGNALYQGYYQIANGGGLITPLILRVGSPALTMPAGDFNIPCRAAWASSGYNYARLGLDYMMVWFNQYIEPTQANYEKFIVTSSDGVTLVPADTTGQLAIDAFGAPAIHLRGGKDEFQINKGTAGPMTLTGTSSDYTPPPVVPPGSPSALGPGV